MGFFRFGVVLSFLRDELWQRLAIILEKRRHVHCQIPNHGIVWQRLQRQALLPERLCRSATGPAVLAVDTHRAGSTHAGAARVAESKRGVVIALNVGQHIQHAHAGCTRHHKGLEGCGRIRTCGAQHFDGKRVGHNEQWYTALGNRSSI